MSLLGSAFGRGLAGAGRGAADIATKYIDDEILRNRSEFMSELQRESALRTEREMDAQKNAPERIARDRAIKRDDALAAGKNARDAELQGINDAGYQAGKTAQAQLDTGRKVEAQNTYVEGTSKAEAAAAGAKQDAVARANARYRESRTGPDLMALIAEKEKALGRPLTPAEREHVAGLGKGGPPETDYETIEESFIDPDGKESKRKFKQLKPEVRAAQQNQRLAEAADKARKDGKAGEAIAEFRAKGLDDAKLALFFTPDELKASAPAPKAGAKPDSAKPSQPGLLDRAWESVGNAAQAAGRLMAPSLDAHAQAALGTGNRAQMRALLDEQSADKPLSDEMRRRLLAALNG
jgi:hypothetical protein